MYKKKEKNLDGCVCRFSSDFKLKNAQDGAKWKSSEEKRGSSEKLKASIFDPHVQQYL